MAAVKDELEKVNLVQKVRQPRWPHGARAFIGASILPRSHAHDWGNRVHDRPALRRGVSPLICATPSPLPPPTSACQDALAKVTARMPELDAAVDSLRAELKVEKAHRANDAEVAEREIRGLTARSRAHEQTHEALQRANQQLKDELALRGQAESKSSTEVSTLRERLDEVQTKLDAQRSRFEAETAECVFFQIALFTPTPLPRNASRHHGISTRPPVHTRQKREILSSRCFVCWVDAGTGPSWTRSGGRRAACRTTCRSCRPSWTRRRGRPPACGTAKR